MPIAMGLEAACELECAALGALLREPREAERTLLLDCRPFLAFCRSHVRAARPVPWNALLRRRARGTPAAALACLLPDRALRARLGRGELARAVVLDESSASVAELPPDGPAHLLLAALQHEMRAGPMAVCFLRGEPAPGARHPAPRSRLLVPDLLANLPFLSFFSPQVVLKASRHTVQICALKPLPRPCLLLEPKITTLTRGFLSMTR